MTFELSPWEYTRHNFQHWDTSQPGWKKIGLTNSWECLTQKCTFDILSHDLWSWLPWQPQIWVELNIPITCVKFHVYAMFHLGISAKKQVLHNLTFEPWPLSSDLYFQGSVAHNFPTWSTFLLSLEKIRLCSPLLTVFWNKRCTFNLLSHDLWLQLHGNHISW